MREYRYKNLIIQGIGQGGVETCYVLPQYNLAFDLGRCPDRLVDIPNLFLTHGHLDHAAGLPYYVSQRSLRKLPTPQIYVPEDLYHPLGRVLQSWQEIEGFTYPFSMHALQEHKRIHLNQHHFIEAQPTFHRVPALGYILFRQSQKLKPEYIGLPGKEIKRLKEKDEPIFFWQEHPLFAFSGDSTLEFVENNEKAREAEVLLLDCTYIDEKRTTAQAREWGHAHLDEVIEKAELFANEKILLTHFSRRYHKTYIREILDQKLPQQLQGRVEAMV